MVFVWCFLQGTEEIVFRVSFGYNLAPLLFKEKERERGISKADNDRPFSIGRFYREIKHNLRRDLLL